MATALLGGIIVGGTRLLVNFQQGASKTIARGQDEDIRIMIRNRLSCRETLKREKATCELGQGVAGYDHAGNKIVEDGNQLLDIDGSKIRIVCWKDNDSGAYLMQVRFWGEDEQVSTSTGKNLFQIPLSCRGGCAPDEWGDPHTLSGGLPSESRRAHRIVDFINQHAGECEQPPLPVGTRAIRRSNAGSGWDDSEITNFDLLTLRQVCNTIGYDNYVSSKCRDGDSSHGGGTGKCNYNNPTPDDDTIHHWDGTKYVSTDSSISSRSEYKSNNTWITEITCSGKR